MKTKNYFLVRLVAFVLMCALFIGIIPASATESFNGAESTGIESGAQPEEIIEEIEEIIEDSELPEPKIIEDENGTQWILGPEISSDLESEMLENSELSEETVHAKRGAKAGATYTVTTLSKNSNLGVYFDQAITFTYDRGHTNWAGYQNSISFRAGYAEQPKYVTETINGSTTSYVAYCASPELPSQVGNAGYTAATSEQAWTNLYNDQKEAIALAIAYGFNGSWAGHQLISPNSPTADEQTKINNVGNSYSSYSLFSREPATGTISKKGYYLNAEQYLATQLIIWEIVTGCRECRSANTTDQYGLVSSSKNSGAKFSENKYATVRYAYDKIDRLLYAHTKVPSYASEFKASAPTYSADKGTDGTWRYTLSDTKAVSDMYDVTPVDPVLQAAWDDTNKIRHSVSGDHKTLWITIVDSDIAARLDGGSNALFKVENKARKLVEGNSSAVIALQAKSSVSVGGVQPQPVASLPESSIKSDPKTAYFKLRANGVTNESYKISIQKVDPNGNPLSGAALKLQKQNVSYTTGKTTRMCTSSTVYYSNIATGVNQNTLLRILDDQNKECPFTCYNSYVVITGRYVQGDDYTFEYQKNVQTTWSDVASWTSTTSAMEFSDPSWLVIPGTYRLVETSAPSGYQVIDPIEFSFTSSDAGKTKTITAIDPYTTRPVTIQKSYSCSDAIYNEKIKGNPLYSLSGAVFDIRLNSATGAIQETVTTDANGEAKLTGKYAVGTVLYAVEKTAPAGYKTASPVRLTVTSDSANNVFRVNDPPVFNTFNTTLQKVDSTKTAKMLQGAVFKYSYYTNYSGTGSPARVWYFRSDSDGDIKYDTSHLASGYSSSSLFTSGTIPLGSIVVEEVVAPSGYSLNTTSKAIYDITQANAGADATGTWTAGSGMFSYSNTTHYLTATNQPLYLKIYKKIAAGSSGDVTGWQFKVYQGSTLIGTYTTNTTETVGGSVCGVIATNIAAGTYRIEEVAKNGWVAQPSQNVTVTNSNTPSNPATVTFVNQQEPNFKIYKSIAANSTGSVTGWQFKVYRGSTLINTYTTTQTEVINGVTYGVITTLLPVGTYRVEEVAKDGWVAQSAQTVVVTNENTANNPASVSFENEKLSVHLEKQYTESGLSDGYSMVTFLSSENQNLLGEHCYSTVTVSLTQNISAASASSDTYIGTDRLTDRSRSTNTVAYAIKTSGRSLVRYIPEAVCYVLHNGRLLEPGRSWYVTASDINHIRFASALSAGDTVQIVYLTQTVDGNATIHHIASDNTVDVHNLTTNKTYWFYEVPVPGYKANGENPQSIQLHGNDNGQLTFINEPDVCGISIEKTTSDGSSVEGWAFNIYRDGDISRYDACTFNGTGNAAYNIPSISHDNHIDDVFAVYVNNSWYDNRNGDMFTYSETTGTLTFLKALPQPSDTVQVVYTRENYDNPYNDDPYITDEHGQIIDSRLPEGIYSVEEIPTLGYLYQPPATGVEVVAGQITAVDFHNVPTDTDIRIEKGFKDGTYGNKQGWEFAVMDVDEYTDLDVDHVFMMDSFIYDSAAYSEDISRMLPGHPNVCGIYSVYRNGVLLSDGHDYQVQGGELDIGLASVENGDEITVVYSPVIDMNYLYHSPNYHIISTNQYGIANVKNLTGEWVVEEIPQYGYLQQPVKNVSVHSKTTEYLNFENTRLAKIQVKKTDTSGYPLEGVQFILQYKGIHEDTWHDAVYSANRNGAAGTFYTDNNINNNKTILTDTNGCASFNCIAASTAYEYRLVETATTTDRNGRQLSLLAQPIEIGVLPKALEFSSSAELQTWLSQQNNVSDYVVNGNSVMQYTLHYTIANGGVTQMPFTGSTEMEKTVLTGSVMLAFAAGMLFIVCRKKREQE